MYHINNLVGLIGRILLAAFFIPSGIGKLTAYAAIGASMAAHGVPKWLLPLVIITELGGGLLLLAGWHARIVAFLLGAYSILAVLIFWLHPADAVGHIVRSAELAVAGGLWAIAAHDGGNWTLDAWRVRRRAATAAARDAVSSES